MPRPGPQTLERGSCAALPGPTRRVRVRALLAALCLAGPAAADVAGQGDTIVNIATVTAQGTTNGGPTDSNPATVSVRIPTKGVLELMGFAPRSTSATQESVSPGAYRPGADPTTPLVALPAPRLTGAAGPLDLSHSQPLLDTGYYHQGDPVFIRVADRDQDLDRNARDTVLVEVTDDLTGDIEVVRLTEDGNATGVFVGYLPTARTTGGPQQRKSAVSLGGASTPYDGVLQVVEQSRLTARYVDSYSNDVLSAAATVDPLSQVFDSRTGLPVSGARVTVVDVASGQPAAAYSDDGVSSYPSTVVSGQSARDGAGRVHDFRAGEFRFPFLRPGTYRYDVQPPAGYAAPSKASDLALQALPGAPFTLLTPGSRGEPFALDNQPSQRVDVPVDPQAVALWVQKSANREVAGVGDAVAYEIAVTNTSGAVGAPAVRAVDRLPAGFRYRRGSAQANGAPLADPVASSDGQTLTFALGDLAAASTVTVRFLTLVGAAAQVGATAVNRASAATANGGTSNQATASVRIGDDFFSARSFILGRVTAGDCNQAEGVGTAAVAGVRVVLEDGTFAITDKKGLYHFEGVRPGLHVVQMDLDSLPAGWAPVSCTRNDRFAGRSFSQFVEVAGQTAWRADFHLKAPPPPPPPPPAPVEPPPPPPPPPAPGEVTLELSHKLDKLAATFAVEAHGTRSPMSAGALTVTLPGNLTYDPGSSSLDGAAVPDPAGAGAALTWALGALPADWTHALTFRAHAAEDAAVGAGAVTVALSGAGGTAATVALEADNALEVGRELVHKPVSLVLRPHFPSFGTALAPEDKKLLASLARRLVKSAPDHIVVVGHTDAQGISKRGQKLFKDNAALSLARAKSVGGALLQVLRLGRDKLQAEGKGELEPLAPNTTAAGRATNRRVEVTVVAKDTTEFTVLRTVKEKSGPVRFETHLMLEQPKPLAQVPGVAVPGFAVPGVGQEAPVAAPAGAGTVGASAATAAASAGTAGAATPSASAASAETTAASAGGAVAPAAPAVADGFLTPQDGDLLADRNGAVQVRADGWMAIHLFVDGKEVDAARIGYKSEDRQTGKTLTTFVGVDFGDRGPHTLLLTGLDPFGNERLHRSAAVIRTGEISQIHFVSAEGNVADGKTPVRARFELLDSQGQVIRGSIRLELREGNLAPLHREGDNLTLDEALGRTVQMDRDGNVLFAPVSSGGSYRAVLGIGAVTGEAQTWATPKLRDWILVGLAEGTAGYDLVTGNLETAGAAGAEESLYADGRVAFFAKGQVAAKWLITAAYDSAKQRQVGTSLFQQIDPQTYFTLYGDASQQQYDAASARKVYLKIERDQFYALFGDFDSGLTVTELSRFSRRMNGVKAELNTRNVEVNAFGARTDQVYSRDEIPGDGTSGLYHLSRRFLTLNSETVTLLTRDRFRSEVVVETRVLTRFTDYSIDYESGTLFFREPVPSRDFQLNPVTIVVEYETQGLGAQDYTMGGRAGLKLLDQRVRAGVTVIHEGEGAVKNDLYGADARLQLLQNTRLRGEVAFTNSRVNGVSTRGDAFLVELAHTTKFVDAKVYFREEQGAFGLGQQAFSEAGTRKWGGDATLHLSERYGVTAQAFRQDTFSTGVERLFGEARFNYATREYGAYLGLLDADDKLLDGSRHTSGQLTAGGKLLLLKERLTLALDYAQSVWGSGSSDFPTRIGARAEYKLTQNLALLTAEEVTFGAGAATNNERVGFRATPWKGGSFTSLVERDLSESQGRVFGNLGLRQTVQLSEAWKLDAGAERSQTLRHQAFYTPNPAFPPASGAVSENFTAATAGANYQVKSLVWDSRVEGRTAQSGDKWSLLSGVVAERNSGWAWAGRGQLFGTRGSDGAHGLGSDLRLGFVYRPQETHWILLDRLDWRVDRKTGVALPTDSWRIVDNFLANWRPRKELQISAGYGAKYGRTVEAGGSSQGYTDEVSVTVRYDVSEFLDVGARASLLHVWGTQEIAWSGGPEVGVSPATNVWLSLGVNVAGYEDHDFSASGYQSRGPYLQLRFKFDQQSVREAAAFLNQQ